MAFFAKKVLTKGVWCVKIIFAVWNWFRSRHGGIAQLARARGSYPRCHWFESSYRHHNDRQVIYIRPVGQEVKTRPFHGCNTSSILVRVTKYAGVVQW